MINIKFLNKNLNIISICIFLIILSIIVIIKPRFIYNKDGSPMEFGLGYRNKTILPIWLVIIIIAILSYYFTLYLVNINRFKF